MRKLIVVILSSLLILGGCSTASIPIYTQLAGESGEITETIAGYTSDASVAKEREVHMTLRNRDKMLAKMYAQSGFKMSFKMVEFNGIMMVLPDTITYREEPDFKSALPMEPSIHPVWATTQSIFGTVAKYGLIGYGINELSGVLSAGFDAAGDTFHGDVNGSYNTAGNDNNWTTGVEIPVLPEGCSGMESFLEGRCQ